MTTYTWIGASGLPAAATVAADWSPTGVPVSGDSAVINTGGTVLEGDGLFVGETAYLDGGRLTFAGDTLVSRTNPSLNANSLITTNVSPVETATATQSIVDALGNFVNQGTIRASGPVGSSMVINVGSTSITGVSAPGYFLNYGTIEADAGNSLTIAIGANAEMFNVGQIVANGGSVLISANTAALAGGYAGVGFVDIQGGGTVETTVNFGTSVTGQLAYYAFTDAAPRNTLKIDNLAGFGGRIIGFQAGDSIDLGTSLAVGTLAFSNATGLLTLDGAGGAVLDTLAFSTGDFSNGTFAVTGTTAGSFVLGPGADGDTILATTATAPAWNNTSGTWQTAANWSGGVVPGVLDDAVIGQGATSPFTLTTGSVPVLAAGFAEESPLAIVRITSATTAGAYGVFDEAGSLEVTNGATLTSTLLRAVTAQAAITIDIGGTVNLTGHVSTSLASSGGTLAVTQGDTFGAAIAGGTLVVNGALLAGPPPAGGGGNILIGYDGAGNPGTVTVNAGGKVTDTSALLSSDPTGFGSLTLNGVGASWTDAIDKLDPLDDRGYMDVGFNNESTNTPASVTPPTTAGTAQLLIENGATLTDQRGGFIGGSVDGVGSATVTTSGMWNLATAGGGFMDVGQAGNGSLSVLNGGTVAVGVAGTFMSNGTLFLGSGIGIGQSLGAQGTITVSGAGSQLSDLEGMTVATSGQGVLSILNGGSVSIAAHNTIVFNGTTSTHGGIAIGQSLGASGTVSVSGAGSQLNDPGGIDVGTGGQGLLTIQNGGSVSIGNAGITVGNSAGASGTMVVGGTGAAATLTLGPSAGGITVGNAGTATVQVNSGGAITINGTGGIGMGGSAGAVGVLTISGGVVTEGATSGGVGVGQAVGSQATLQVLNGGTLALNGSGLGIGANGAGTKGTVSVSGANSLIKTAGTTGITVGGAGSGGMSITSGATVSDAGVMLVGINSGGSGTLTVNGGTLTAASMSIVGNSATATGLVNLGSGGIITLAGGAFVNAGGSLVMTGGTLAPTGALNVAAGGIVSGFGKVTAGGNNAGSIVALGGLLDLGGVITGAGQLQIAAESTLQVDAAPGATPVVNFKAAGGELILNAPGTAFANAVTGMTIGDRIELGGGASVFSASLVNGNTIAVATSGGTYNLTNVAFASGVSPTLVTGVDAATGDGFVQVAVPASAVTAAYTAALRIAPTSAILNQDVAAVNGGSNSFGQFESQLLATAQTTTVPALLCFDFMSGAAPSSGGVTFLTTYATDLQSGNYSFDGGFHLGTTPGQFNLPQFSVLNTFVNFCATDVQLAGNPFTAAYLGLSATPSTANRTTFFNEVYQQIFGFAPAPGTTNLFVNNMVPDPLNPSGPQITTFQFYVEYAGSELGGYGAIAGVLLSTAMTSNLGPYPAAVNAFINQAVTSTVAGTDTAPYGQSLLTAFPPGSSTPGLSGGGVGDGPIITVSNSDQLIDPGVGNYTIQFLPNHANDKVVLNAGGVDQITGFNLGSDALNLGTLLSDTALKSDLSNLGSLLSVSNLTSLFGGGDLGKDIANLGSLLNGVYADVSDAITELGKYISVTDQGPDVLIGFDQAGQGNYTTVADLHGLGDVVTGLQTLLGKGGITFS